MEADISRAMRARVKDFKNQADSLTLEGVRRMLEKDMGLTTFALDAHKRFIKQCLNECFESLDDENISKNSREDSQQTIQSEKEETNPHEELQLQKEITGPSSGDEKNKKESPVSVEKETIEHETEEAQDSIIESFPSKDTIKKAIKKRASYFRANSEKITLSGVRRLLEEDLKLGKNALDVHKSFINELVDKVIQGPDVESKKEIKKKSVKKASNSSSKGSTNFKKGDANSDSNASLSGDEEVDEEGKRPKKGKARSTESSKKRKRSTNEIKSSSNGRNKPLESAMEKSSDTDEGGNNSEDGNSQSSGEENVKKKRETSTNSYGKRVDHLKSVIKSCGMSVPPSVYKKATQAPESKREAYLIKELEEILGREGLSTNPNEKEIKEVKKKKARAKELEGIDMSNIVSSTRRRSTFNFIMPPKPKVLVESDEDEEEDTDDDGSDSEDASDGFNEDAGDESE